MTEEKTCYNCGNKNCHRFYATVKHDIEEHHETYEYRDFDCVNHDKWEEMKVEEIRTDSTEPLKNAKKITEDEISKIKEHIEIHARREPRAIKITAILRKAVDELERIERLEKENSELKADNGARKFAMAMSEKVEKQLREENAELKVKVGLSIDCEKAQKNGELCLGYGGDEDEPCEQCKNCIKCECGYYQLGETEKDEQLTKAKEIIKELLDFDFLPEIEIKKRAEQFLKEE